MLYVKGNPEKIMNLSVNLSDEEKNALEEKITSFQSRAGRILAFAHKKLDQYTGEETQEELETDLIYDGFVVISDPLSLMFMVPSAAAAKQVLK